MCQYIKLRDCRKQEFLGKGEAQRIWLKILGFLRFSNKKNLVCLPLQKFEEADFPIRCICKKFERPGSHMLKKHVLPTLS